jgi:hypothetical protein
MAEGGENGKFRVADDALQSGLAGKTRHGPGDGRSGQKHGSEQQSKAQKCSERFVLRRRGLSVLA